MNLFRRFSATFSGTVASAVSQMENHDSVVGVILRDTRRAAAQAQVRYARVKRDGAELARRLDELVAAENTWTERAKETALLDEDKAMECLSRRNQCREQRAAIETALREHKIQERDLAAALKHIDERLREIETTRNLLRTRESTVYAKTSLARSDNAALDDIWERWETQILESEYLGPRVPRDELEEEFNELETRASLKAQLDELISKGDES